MQNLLPLYLLLMNAAGLIFMYLDKQFAKRKLRRIPEATLLFTALMGGSLGSLLGMMLFRHKTRKPAFRILIPLFLLLHIVLWTFPT